MAWGPTPPLVRMFAVRLFGHFNSLGVPVCLTTDTMCLLSHRPLAEALIGKLLLLVGLIDLPSADIECYFACCVTLLFVVVAAVEIERSCCILKIV